MTEHFGDTAATTVLLALGSLAIVTKHAGRGAAEVGAGLSLFALDEWADLSCKN